MQSRSIILWLITTLLLLAFLPILLSWYQIKSSQSVTIDQAQKSHLIFSQSTADRIDSQINQLFSLAKAVGNNQEVYLKPDSEESAEVLKSLLVSEEAFQAIGLTYLNQGQLQIVQIANKNKDLKSDFLKQKLLEQSEENIRILKDSGKQFLSIRTNTARPNVDITIIQSIDFNEILDPQILGQSSELFLIDSNIELIASPSNKAPTLTENIKQQISTQKVVSAAFRPTDSNLIQSIISFAQIPNVNWYVISKQPIEFAEQATSKMTETSKEVFTIVILALLLLSLFAYTSWVKPIRNIIKAQKKLMGGDDDLWKRNEFEALEDSFEALNKHINDRNALGQVFVDRYQVISPLGHGGMGSVFLGWDPKLNRKVALKTFPISDSDAFGSREDMSQTIIQEALTAAKISHRNIVSIYDVVSSSKTAFIAMEFIEGESLQSLLRRKNTLNLKNTIALIIAILRGLNSAHEKGFIHRDVKPGNILLDINGNIKLTDFGTTNLANLMVQNDNTGTMGYIAPEVLNGQKATKLSDIFAVGVIIATCLLGKNPFIGKSDNQTKNNTLNKNVVFPRELLNLSPKAFTVIQSCLAKDPSKRPSSATQARQLFAQSLTDISWNVEEVGVQITRNQLHENIENTTLFSNTVNS